MDRSQLARWLSVTALVAAAGVLSYRAFLSSPGPSAETRAKYDWEWQPIPRFSDDLNARIDDLHQCLSGGPIDVDCAMLVATSKDGFSDERDRFWMHDYSLSLAAQALHDGIRATPDAVAIIYAFMLESLENPHPHLRRMAISALAYGGLADLPEAQEALRRLVDDPADNVATFAERILERYK